MIRHFSPFDLGVFDEASHVAVMQAFFDASEQGDFMVVAGYLFRKKDIKSFNRQWGKMLRRFGIEHFHMTDCNAEPGRGQFTGMSKATRIACQTEAISAIIDHATLGMTNSVRISDFDRLVGDEGYMTNPFSLCVHGAMMMCRMWALEADPTARIVFVFEAGDRFQSDAQNILSSIAEDQTRRRFFNYEDHAFLTKRGSIPTQAADILAWHGAKQYVRKTLNRNERLRTDFSCLLDGVATLEYFHSEQDLDQIKRITSKRLPYPNAMQIAGLGMRMNKGNQKQIIRELGQLVRPESLAHILRIGTEASDAS